jgi:hypothetical protein
MAIGRSRNHTELGLCTRNCRYRLFAAKDVSEERSTRGRNGERDVRKRKRSNETHASTTNNDACLFSQGRWPGESCGAALSGTRIKPHIARDGSVNKLAKIHKTATPVAGC